MTTKDVLKRLTEQGLLGQDDFSRLTAHEEEQRKAEQMKNRLIGDGYVSLTELAKEHGHDLASKVIHTWMRHRTTIALLTEWEQVNNPLFHPLAHEGYNGITPKRWIWETCAIGMKYKQGHHGGVWAYPEIACDFLMWLLPSFQMEVISAYCNLIREVPR